jgi:glycosyltransferase involved in cell wall biosynthesis
MRALQRCADSYVSLHRAEGFGLGLAECMALGKPVIGTAWSGNLDFMTNANSCLVDYRLVPVGEGEYQYAEGMQWAEADVDHAAACMKRLVDAPGFASSLGAQAGVDIRNRLSPSGAARAIAGYVESLRGGPRSAHARRERNEDESTERTQ